jgi:hypothetical protein
LSGASSWIGLPPRRDIELHRFVVEIDLDELGGIACLASVSATTKASGSPT